MSIDEGVGPATSEKLQRRGVHTIGQLASVPEDALVAMLGPAAGRHLHALAHNRDSRPVRTGVLRLRFADFTRASRSRTLAQATAETRLVLDVVRALLAGSRGELADRGCTLVGVAVSDLVDADAVQLPLPFTRGVPSGLDHALDAVRHRFGTSMVTRGVLLRHGEGLSVPSLPD